MPRAPFPLREPEVEIAERARGAHLADVEVFGPAVHFCFEHARKESQARSARKLASELAYCFSGDYLSANDLSVALGRLLPAVLKGDVRPRTAGTIAYLAQTLVQTIQVAQHEYINAFGANDWRNAIRNSVNSNHDYFFPPANTPTVVAGLQTGASAPQDQPVSPKLGEKLLETEENCYSQNG
jgi:hypothetical protein